MKPTKDNLKDEIKYRIALLEESIENSNNDLTQSSEQREMIRLLFSDEHSKHSEFLSLIEIFENRIGYEAFDVSKYTPILDYKTKLPLKIGDRVENNNRQCGILKFDECFNKYVIKTDTGGHISSTVYIKIPELYDYKIDNTSVECRKNPHKQRW